MLARLVHGTAPPVACRYTIAKNRRSKFLMFEETKDFPATTMDGSDILGSVISESKVAGSCCLDFRARFPQSRVAFVRGTVAAESTRDSLPVPAS